MALTVSQAIQLSQTESPESHCHSLFMNALGGLKGIVPPPPGMEGYCPPPPSHMPMPAFVPPTSLSNLDGVCAPHQGLQDIVPSPATYESIALTLLQAGPSPWRGLFQKEEPQKKEHELDVMLSSTDVSKSENTSGTITPSDEDGKRGKTTMMIQNIPWKADMNEVVQAIHSAGFVFSYSSVDLPVHTRKPKRNLGYAFVHFNDAETAAQFAKAFQNYSFKGSNFTKRCIVKPGHEANLFK